MQRPQRKPKLQGLHSSLSSPLDTSKTMVSLSGLPRSGEHYSRASEFYGFVALTSTYLLFIIYLLWALLPDEYIVWLGVTWYPSREWALLVPAWSVIVVLLTYFVYWALAFYATPSLNDMKAIVDSRTSLPRAGAPNPYKQSAKANAIPELYDIPIGLVNRVLYGESEGRQ